MYEIARGFCLSVALGLVTAATFAADRQAPARMPSDTELVTETVFERFPDGQVRAEREVALDVDLNFVNHGQFKMYDEQGTVIASGAFVANLREGKWTRQYKPEESTLFAHAPFKQFEAPFLSEANFEHGELNGKWTITDARGRKMSEIDFVHGTRDGKLIFYTPAGGIQREIDFEHGVINGFDRTNNEQGELVSEQKYLDGQRYVLHTESYISTKKKTEGYFLHPPVTIESRDDWWTATLATFGQGEGEPIRHGSYNAWHVNGQLRTQGEYDQGKAVGDFVWWHPNGQVAIRGSYKNGKHQGKWQWWHENGMRAANGQYENGVRIGRWLQWETDGQLAKATDYGAGNENVAEGAEGAQEAAAPASARRPGGAPAASRPRPSVSPSPLGRGPGRGPLFVGCIKLAGNNGASAQSGFAVSGAVGCWQVDSERRRTTK